MFLLCTVFLATIKLLRYTGYNGIIESKKETLKIENYIKASRVILKKAPRGFPKERE